MDKNIQNLVRARIDAFAADITELLTDAVADAVARSLGSSASRPAKGAGKRTSASRGRGRPAKVAPEDLLRAVAKGGTAGLRMEQLGKAMATPTKGLVRPMKLLLEQKKVKRSGQARGTTYRVA